MVVHNLFALVAVCVWIAFVCVACFREMIYRVKPAGVTVSLGITQLMFKSLNVVEFGAALIIIVSFFMLRESPFDGSKITLFIPTCLLLLQTSWLLPALFKRTDILVRGVPLLHGQLRLLYVATELVKVSSLVVFSFHLLG